MTAEGQAFRDFANGGHVQSDAELAALAARQAMNQLRLEKADEEMASALFGNDDDGPSAAAATTTTTTTTTTRGKKKKQKQNVKLVKSSSHPDGTTRGVWKGTYGTTTEVEVLKDPQPQPPSLLD